MGSTSLFTRIGQAPLALVRSLLCQSYLWTQSPISTTVILIFRHTRTRLFRKLLVALEELDLTYEIVYQDNVDALLPSSRSSTLQGFSDEHLPVLVDHRKNNRPVWYV